MFKQLANFVWPKIHFATTISSSSDIIISALISIVEFQRNNIIVSIGKYLVKHRYHKCSFCNRHCSDFLIVLIKPYFWRPFHCTLIQNIRKSTMKWKSNSNLILPGYYKLYMILNKTP